MAVRFPGGKEKGFTEKYGGTVVVVARRRRVHEEEEEEGGGDIAPPGSSGAVNAVRTDSGGTTASVEYAGKRTTPSERLAARCRRRYTDLRTDGGGAVIFHFRRVRHPTEHHHRELRLQGADSLGAEGGDRNGSEINIEYIKCSLPLP
mmetsp:Transcript_17299/g.26381  ORF Transcript_17299/g.26381 Transcript_17299/m.26381 type:complete len:148 (-) Transcript_17299:82-525(-)